MKENTTTSLRQSTIVKSKGQGSLNLLKYSAIALGFMATDKDAEAQTLYFDYSPDEVVTLEIDTFNATTSYIEQYADAEIDLLRDGIVDASFVFTGSRYVGGPGTDIRSSWLFEPKSSRLNVAQLYGFWGAAFQAKRFVPGDVIDDALDWYSGPALLYRFTQFESTYIQVGSWSDGPTQGALALRYEINPGNYIYGYLRLFLSDTPSTFGDCCATLQDFRWNMNVNQPITVDLTAPVGDCDTPTGLAATPLSPTTIALDWTPDMMAPKTQLQGKAVTAANFGNNIATGNSRTFNGLTPGQAYEWKARSICSNGLVSDMSPLSSFTMPLLIEPSGVGTAESRFGQDQNELTVGYNGKDILLQASAPISRYVLHDLNGKELLAKNCSANTATIEASLPAGVYVLMAEVEQDQIWQKVVVR